MTNEQLVSDIQAGINISENLKQLYYGNLPLIRQFIRPYIYFEPEADLLQQAYIGLWTATTHYESGENVKFMTLDSAGYKAIFGELRQYYPHTAA